MVSALRVNGVIRRRISAAMRRGDRLRANSLQRMLTDLNKGRETPGQVLIDLQCYAKTHHKVEPIVRRGHGRGSKEWHGWKSDQHRKRPSTENLRGGIG